MKKIIFILFILLIIIGSILILASCNDNKAFKIGVILIGQKDEMYGYTYEHMRGINEAINELNLSTNDLIIVDQVSDEDSEIIKSKIDYLIKEGCKLIIGTSYGYMEEMQIAAENNPDIIFTHATGDLDTLAEDKPGNMNNYFGRIYQAWYLAGIVVGKSINEQDNVGFISSFGIQNGECTSAINAFTLGLQTVNGNSKVFVRVLGSWYDPEKEIEYATKLIENDECEIIVTDTDTTGPATVAASYGKQSIGYNSDMSLAIDPNCSNSILTSVIWNWSVYYAQAIKNAISCFSEKYDFVSSDNWRAFGNYYGDYTTGLYGIAPVTSESATDILEIINLVENTFNNNEREWKIFSNIQLHFLKESGKYNVQYIERTLFNVDNVEISNINENDLRQGMNYWLRGIVDKSTD
ncbi:MAG: BMP family ABC transporter substrate-binding protein [Christensenellaceae bacterium]|nr:BMP family ABC transporter substrate-binding protein [Christensenellaceae bacterium]